jgi:hypothetical protein
MQNFNSSFNTSFVQTFNWTAGDSDIQKAMEIISAPSEHQGEPCVASSEDYYDVSKTLAAHPDTPANVLDHLSNCIGCPKVLERVASNASVHTDTLKKLANNDSIDVRRAVAENSNLDADTLHKLANDQHIDVRYTLAENPAAPLPVLEQLSSDDNPYVANRAEMTRKRVISQGGQAPGEIMPRQQGIRKAV